MSNANLLGTVFGGVALVAGVAFGVSSHNVGSDEIAELTAAAEQNASVKAAARATALAEAERLSLLQHDLAAAETDVRRAAFGDSLTAPAPVSATTLGLGRAALPEELAAWDVDVLPDGRGLPEGSGDVWTGEEVFVAKCASCHGDFAEGVDNWPVLAGGFNTLADEDPVKTVGSYWPYLSTSWDYINRSMPFGEAGTLTPDETYAIVAYLMYSNDMVDDDFVLSHENFTDVEMHNADGFVVDDRPELEYAEWSGAPCMENCADEVKVTMRSVFLVETPLEGGSNSVMNHASDEELPSFTADGPSFIPEVENAPAADPLGEEIDGASLTVPEGEDVSDQATVVPVAGETDTAVAVASVMGGDPEAGEAVFRQCKSCHQIGAGAVHRVGPHLNGIFGRQAGSHDDFRYSDGLVTAGADGLEWHADTLDAFLENPRAVVSKTRMSFRGISDANTRHNLIAYLRTFSDDPANIPEADPTADPAGFSVDPAILAIKGDPAYGEYLSSDCTTCHQVSGGDDGIPSIVQWPEEDFVTAMHAYKDKHRDNQVMQMMAGRLNDEEIAALAAYFATLGQ